MAVPVVSDTVLLALIAAFPACMAAAGALIIALRTSRRQLDKEKYEEGAANARGRRQRKTDRRASDRPLEKETPP